jgi:hypothetical protein
MGSQPSSYPHGFAHGVAIRGVPVLNSYAGNVFWVSSGGGSDGNPGTFDKPWATWAYAITQCTADNGDLILLKAGHAETVSAAGGITMSKAGVAVLGLGMGADRATITFGTSVSASILVTGASCSIENVLGTSGVDQLTQPFDIRAADFYGDIAWRDTADNVEAVRAVLTTAAADRLHLKLRYRGRTGGSHCVAAATLVGVDVGDLDVNLSGKFSTSGIQFATTACTEITIYGYMYNSGTTDGSKNVVDTITGSTWYSTIDDGAAGTTFTGGSGAAASAKQAVPAADSTANAFMRDVVGNKTDAVLTATGTTKSILAYVKTALANVGFLADAAAYVSGTTTSLMSYVKGLADLQERVAVSATAILADGTTIFTIAGGPIQIQSLISECVNGGDSAASTVQYSNTVTGLSAQTISNASGSVANAAAHATVSLIGTALATAAVYNSKGANLGMTNQGGIICGVGIITTVIGGANSTTGTWRHILRYKPLVSGVTVS